MMINRGATTTPSWAEPRPGADEIQDEVGLVFFVLFLMQKKKKEMVYISFFFFSELQRALALDEALSTLVLVCWFSFPSQTDMCVCMYISRTAGSTTTFSEPSRN